MLISSRILGLEKENEALIVKVANLTMRLAHAKEIFLEKDNKIISLEALQETFSHENEELKNFKETLLKKIQEKDEEIERISKLNKLSMPIASGKSQLI